MTLEFLGEDFHYFAIAQRAVLCLDLALLAKDERVSTVRIAVLVETLTRETSLRARMPKFDATYIFANRMATDKCKRVWL